MAISVCTGDARLDIAPDIGGAIVAFTHADRNVLRPTSAEARETRNVRGHACYPLVPYSNRIAGARFRFDGATYALAPNPKEHPNSIHGVGWQRPWHVVEHDRTSALLSLEHRPLGDDARAWPWPFDAWQSFTLAVDDDRALLTAVIGIRNRGDVPFPFGLGFHPFFPRDASTALGFRADAVWHTDAAKLPTTRVPAAGRFGFDPMRAIGDDPLDNVYVGWDGEATLDDARGVTRVRSDRACRFFVVYAPVKRDFIALEPVTQMADAFNRASCGERDSGVRVLAPGAAFSCTMQIASASAR